MNEPMQRTPIVIVETTTRGDQSQTPEAGHGDAATSSFGLGGSNGLRASWTVVRTRSGAICGGGAGCPVAARPDDGFWASWTSGWRPAFANIVATRTWCAKSCNECMAYGCRCARWSGRCTRGANSWRRRRGPRCDSRRHRDGSSRSILGRRRCGLVANRNRCTCSWPRWAIRGGRSWPPSITSGNRPGWTGWKGLFTILAG